MKRLILVIMILMAFIAAGVVPKAIYAADGEESSLLTPEEQAFRNELNLQYNKIFGVINVATVLTYGNVNRSADTRFLRNWLAENPPDCNIQSSPAVFADVRAKWNSEVCPAYTTLHNNLVSILNDENVIENPDWTAVRSQLVSRLDPLNPGMNRLLEKALEVLQLSNDRKEELIEKRKEVREKAKPLIEEAKDLLKKDAEEKKKNDKNAGSDEDKKDSEDIFDTDCFIATAAYGSPTAREIDILRQFRDEFLVHNYPGRAFVDFYYTTSPPIARFISEHDMLRVTVREGFVDPIVAVVEFTESWWAE